MGGQAGLNLGMELAESGFLDSHGVTLLGTTAETIRNAEGRQEFKDLMERIGEPCAPSLLVENIQDGVDLPIRSAIRSYCVLPIHWAVPAVVSHIIWQSLRAFWKRSASFPCRTGSGRKMYQRLERNRVRSYARQCRKLYYRM